MTRVPNRKTFNIVLCINIAYGGWRDFLTGFLEASRQNANWGLRIIDPQECSPERIDRLTGRNVDAIVAGNLSEPAVSRLMQSSLPTVLIGSQHTARLKSRENVICIHHDDLSIGEEGARNLLALGNFNSWAFLPAGETVLWSKLRQQGFARQLARHRKKVSVFRCPFQPGSGEREQCLTQWIRALAKPAAVMAACDNLAIELLAICNAGKVQVPRQVSVLGVDNDRLLCESSRPALSSIAPDHFAEGRLAAAALADMLRRRKTRSREILCTSKTLSPRESTSATAPATILIQRALEFVRVHVTQDIAPTDVARHLGVSRSLLDLRFRQYHETTLAEEIRAQRLGEVRRQLLHSSASIAVISRNCGWKTPNGLKNTFRRHYGMSMSEMRRENR